MHSPAVSAWLLTWIRDVFGQATSSARIKTFFARSSSQTFTRNFSLKMVEAKKEAAPALQPLDPIQEALLNEVCILVDENDQKTGSATKKECHLLKNGQSLLHRAFSVFIFNDKGELLLQQRADSKITFPDTFTNTCCSHPLAVDSELDENSAVGVRRAARRKLQQELGILPEQVPLEELQYITRIHYRAPSDEIWGEHEIDYILFMQKNVDLVLNPNEVKSVRYVSQDDLRRMIEDDRNGNLKLTPWFRLICKSQLFQWWNNLNNLKKFEDYTSIHRFY
ncbi:hypothetical protein RvY_13606 [Ramazzottius varieornatus]|uniref:isopentenyl-diphosphate Delta-isomerase n=1 Tax=Ramazzottius varieornatus TaxID=947166 RepID=A0A1D1VQ94_RAMVA|nr:hypothetical protein RvY_13606 [Ramazzottius varieornatus]